jgi:hypothetical protein
MKKKKIYIYLLAIILAFGGYYFYTIYQKKQDADFAQEMLVSDFEDNIPSQCEKGEWTEFPAYSQSGTFSEYKGNANIKSSSGDKFSNQDGSISFVTDKNYTLTFFAGRDVRIEGVDVAAQGKQEIYVKRIKCVGKEANADIRSQRQNLMKYISDNIGTLAMEKSHGSAWQIQTFYFVNDTDIYVEYESPGSIGGDSPYDARLWLIRASKMDTSVPAIETLAYIQEDENDPDKNVVKVGQDLYKDANNMTVYEFDSDKKTWVLQ